MKRILGVVLALCTAAGPAQAGLIDQHFGGGTGCYSRVYDRGHLSQHPNQLVTEIHLGASSIIDPAYAGTLLEFGFTLRGGASYGVTAYCLANGCSLEGDSGSFRLAEDGKGLLLSVDDFVTLEGETGFSPDLADSDDTVFLLYPARAGACR
jgi:hypothetical protein